MAKPKRFLLRLLLLVVVLIVAAVAAAPLLPLSLLKPAVESRLSDALGRKVTIASLRLNLIGGAYFTITGMTVQEDPAFGDGVFVSADQVRADLDLLQYLRTRRISIDGMTVTSPQIHLVRNADGSWNWTTLGKQPSERAASRLPSSVMNDAGLSALWFLPLGEMTAVSFKKIRIENASVSLTNRAAVAAPEVVYKSVGLNASLAPAGGADSQGGSQAIGEFTAQSEEDGDAALLRATLPFDLQIERRGPTLVVSGSIGPGPLETTNLTVGSLSIDAQISAERGTSLTGNGQLSATVMFIRPVNLSERVASTLRVNQIGNMDPGTLVGGLESNFQMSQGAVETTSLRIQDLDGLGDATAQNGNFKIDSGLTVSYRTTVTLSADATSRVKSANTMLGVIATVLETNNRVSIPININGDVRRPQIYVDVSRIF